MGGPQVSVLASANKDPLAKLTKLGKLSEQGGTRGCWLGSQALSPARPALDPAAWERKGRACL